jgi:hypothetical protein
MFSVRWKFAPIQMPEQARTAVEQPDEALEKLRAPALRLGTLMQELPNGRALVCARGAEYICKIQNQASSCFVDWAEVSVLNQKRALLLDPFRPGADGPG